jgi:hypothetical protein
LLNKSTFYKNLVFTIMPRILWPIMTLFLLWLVAETTLLDYGRSGEWPFLVIAAAGTGLAAICLLWLVAWLLPWLFSWRASPLKCGDYLLEFPPLSVAKSGEHVYRARKAGSIDISYAVKYRPHRANRGQTREFFYQESSIHARLMHPNIVRLIDAGEGPAGLYMVMEYVPGLSLRALLKTLHYHSDFLPVPLALRISLAIVAALDYAQRQIPTFVHRNLKPSNVLLGFQGQIKLLDFGLARGNAVTPFVSSARRITGSLAYLSPEQLGAGPVDIRSDIFTVGVLLYQMLTGELPWSARRPQDLMDQILRQSPPSPRIIRPEIDAELEGIVRRALEKLPERRYQTPAELLAALQTVARNLAAIVGDAEFASYIQAHPATLPTRRLAWPNRPTFALTAAWHQRLDWPRLGVGLGLILLLLMELGLTWQLLQTYERRRPVTGVIQRNLPE